MEKDLKNPSNIFFQWNLLHNSRRLLINWLDLPFIQKDFATFILSGYAGTGKTTLVGAYIKALNELKIKSVLLAPTGRSSESIGFKYLRKRFLLFTKKSIVRERWLGVWFN
jgi:exodeoxyribonuclease V